METVNTANLQIEGLTQIAEWLSSLIILGGVTSIAVLSARIMNKNEIKIIDISLSLKYFPIAALTLTGIHAFLTWMFIQKEEEISVLGRDEAVLAWSTLVNSKAFIFFNMKPRYPNGTVGKSFHIYAFSHGDTTYWLSLGLSIVVFLSILFTCPPMVNRELSVNVRVKSIYSRIIRILNKSAIGCLFVGVNWMIGSQWAIIASRLAGATPH